MFEERVIKRNPMIFINIIFIPPFDVKQPTQIIIILKQSNKNEVGFKERIGKHFVRTGIIVD
jgi:hypothetical protein